MTDIRANALHHNPLNTTEARLRGAKYGLPGPAVLWPYNASEAITIAEASAIARRSKRTIRDWCARFDIGRRIAGGQWMVSRVALQMLLEGDYDALRGYLSGDRHSEAVASFYARLGIPVPRTTIIGTERSSSR
jgi:hypothetical protein